MIEVQFTQDMIGRSFSKAKKMGELRFSITQGEGNIAGFLGEEMVAQFLGISAKIINTYDYDIIFKGKRIDVKTKRTTALIQYPHYEASVAAYNTNQACDYYVFTRVLFIREIPIKGWIFGYLSKEDFYQKAQYRERGEHDPSNDFFVITDCYNIRYDKLKPMEELIIECS